VAKIIVIGAGYGGLSAAALLAKDGHDVMVLERHDQPGGRARLWEHKGFKFDMGPSWYLMPDVFEKFFAEFGKRPEDYLSLTRLDPAFQIVQEQMKVDIPVVKQKLRALFAQLEPDGDKKLERYLSQAKEKYDESMKHFLYREYRYPWDFFSPKLIGSARKLDLLSSLQKSLDAQFQSETAKRILSYNMLFLGGTPKNLPALYSLMSHADLVLGVWYPQGGMHAVARAMERVGKECGVEFKYGVDVERILTSNGAVAGVQTTTGIIDADIVIANADYEYVETSLLDKPSRSLPASYWDKRTVAPSCLCMYLGMNTKLPLAHHTIVLTKDWTTHWDSLFEHPSWPKDPCYYICCPSKSDRSVAPAGCENVFVLVPLAAGLEDTQELRAQMRNFILYDLERISGVPVKKHIVVERLYAHNDFVNDYRAYRGTAFGLAQTLLQTAYFRPSQRSKKVRNLYYVGHYVHPGVGVPPSVISGHIVRDIIRSVRVKYVHENHGRGKRAATPDAEMRCGDPS
jgi:phytoene desaturase